MDMFGKHGSPPQLFQGPLAVWMRGLRFWHNNVTSSCMPEAWFLEGFWRSLGRKGMVFGVFWVYAPGFEVLLGILMRQNVMERTEQTLAHDQYVRDEIIEARSWDACYRKSI